MRHKINVFLNCDSVPCCSELCRLAGGLTGGGICTLGGPTEIGT